ncbi:MAG: UvrD-helicase domain-containing protein, partial [Pirellula sp.]
FDEMFVWAKALLEDHKNAGSWLRSRFPFLMVDEMQDTCSRSGGMLHTIFPRASSEVIVQRVGDPNQAIYDNIDDAPDESDPFPDIAAERNLHIANSYRFGQSIASLASPFAVTPIEGGGLCGIRPKGPSKDCKAAIFVFPDNDASQVLSAYGKYVLENFSDEELEQGLVTAVGSVHQSAIDVTPGNQQYPKTVPHYWDNYSAAITANRPNPKSLTDYVRVAQAAVQSERNVASGVEKFASGIMRLASLLGNNGTIKLKIRKHRAIATHLESENESHRSYQRIVRELLVELKPLTPEYWEGASSELYKIALFISGGENETQESKRFLTWDEKTAPTQNIDHSPAKISSNVFHASDGGRTTGIQLGSIHSVKGQTHLATLVLSTYWYAHSSKQMLPWLLGKKTNGNGANARDQKRLLQTYVAMTRPSHLVCLAIPRSIVGQNDVYYQNCETLRKRGWLLTEIDCARQS